MYIVQSYGKTASLQTVILEAKIQLILYLNGRPWDNKDITLFSKLEGTSNLRIT